MRPALNAGLAACCFGLDGVLRAACLLSSAWSPGVLAFGAVTLGVRSMELTSPVLSLKLLLPCSG